MCEDDDNVGGSVKEPCRVRVGIAGGGDICNWETDDWDADAAAAAAAAVNDDDDDDEDDVNGTEVCRFASWRPVVHTSIEDAMSLIRSWSDVDEVSADVSASNAAEGSASARAAGGGLKGDDDAESASSTRGTDASALTSEMVHRCG